MGKKLFYLIIIDIIKFISLKLFIKICILQSKNIYNLLFQVIEMVLLIYGMRKSKILYKQYALKIFKFQMSKCLIS